ncbi:uncharacterized protein SOCE26_099560 [Sorangium cellulosum]|uniref:Peptidase S1 domain-containing protein n=1 Tax=Sorangium cellulosum TaxID=56 RepID=A0A2L0FAA5_SORCE|nr:trypsin-like serine protease [Sorangium cellulosum]AUX48422.1 uncharacterized protein SOCE26_099560 [Sorangium cellulosum]
MKKHVYAALGSMLGALSLVACMAGEVSDDVDGEVSEELVSEAEQAIKDGTPASPDEAMVVQLYGGLRCTGTLLSDDRVLTAAHCLTSSNIASYWVKYAGENRTVSQAIKYPNASTNGIDVAILVLSSPYSLGMLTQFPEVNISDTDHLIGREVTCYGYGKQDVGGTCTTDADCATGFTCDTNRDRCYQASTTLRKGDFTIISDPEDDDIWFRLDVPNASGQIPLPGDSGGPCILDNPDWSKKHVVGVFKAGNHTNYARYTSREAFASWVLNNM